ncbi:MAG: MFS transporter [Bacillota bacterium]|nr:MFS transporter [Bacillota bacterium]
MATLLLLLTYLLFVGLGLPAALLGSAWPVLHVDCGFPVAWAGILSALLALGRILASLLTARLGRRHSTGQISLGSLLLMAVSVLGFAQSRSFALMAAIILAYGFGSGVLDAVVNHYVNLHYRAWQLTWLHLSFSFGQAMGPVLLGLALAAGRNWTGGYRLIAVLLLAIALVLLLSFRLWSRCPDTQSFTRLPPASAVEAPPAAGRSLLALPGLVRVLLGFFCFTSFEALICVWISTYLVAVRGLAPERAAALAGLYSFGVIGGRVVSSFIADRLGARRMLAGGSAGLLAGIVLLLLPTRAAGFAIVAFVLIGVGAAPIFPAVIRQIPERFGNANSQAVTGLHMAAAAAGALVLPPLPGLLARRVGMAALPWFVLLLWGLMVPLLLMRPRRRRARADRV